MIRLKSRNRRAATPPRTKIAQPPPRTFATTTDEIALYDDLVDHNELAITRIFS